MVGLDRCPSQCWWSFTRNGWDTCSASVAPLASLPLKVLLNATQKFKCLKEVVHTQSISQKSWSSCKVVGHLKLKDINSIHRNKHLNITPIFWGWKIALKSKEILLWKGIVTKFLLPSNLHIIQGDIPHNSFVIDDKQSWNGVTPFLEKDPVVFADLVTGVTQQGNGYMTSKPSLASWSSEPEQQKCVKAKLRRLNGSRLTNGDWDRINF